MALVTVKEVRYELTNVGKVMWDLGASIDTLVSAGAAKPVDKQHSSEGEAYV